MELSITLDKPDRAAALFGPADKHLKMIREALGVQIFARGGQVKVTGSAKNVSHAAAVINQLQRAIRHDRPVTPATVAQAVSAAATEAGERPRPHWTSTPPGISSGPERPDRSDTSMPSGSAT